MSLPEEPEDLDGDEGGGPTPLHFLARHADDESKLAWGSKAPYALIVLINLVCFQVEGLGEPVFMVSFVATLMSIYCTRVFYRVLSELAANWSPSNPFLEGFLRTTMALSFALVIAMLGYAIFM